MSSLEHMFEKLGLDEAVAKLRVAAGRSTEPVARQVWRAVYRAELMALKLELCPPPVDVAGGVYQRQVDWISMDELTALLANGGGAISFNETPLLTRFFSLESAVCWAVKSGGLPLPLVVKLCSQNLRFNKVYVNILKNLVKNLNLPEPEELRWHQIRSFVRFLRSEQFDAVTIAEILVYSSDAHLLVLDEFLTEDLSITRPALAADLRADLWQRFYPQSVRAKLQAPPKAREAPARLLFSRPTLQEAQAAGDCSEIVPCVNEFVNSVAGKNGTLTPQCIQFLNRPSQISRELASISPDFICVDCEWNPVPQARGKSVHVALMQIAFTWKGKDHVFLIDMAANAHDPSAIKTPILSLFSRSLVVGVSFRMADIVNLRKYFDDDNIAIPRYLELYTVICAFPNRQPPIGHGLENCFRSFMPDGQLPKQYALSNWSYRPLLNREAWYAATDVLVPLFICKLALRADVKLAKLVEGERKSSTDSTAASPTPKEVPLGGGCGRRRLSERSLPERSQWRRFLRKFEEETGEVAELSEGASKCVDAESAAGLLAESETAATTADLEVPEFITNWQHLGNGLRLLDVPTEVWKPSRTDPGVGPPASLPAGGAPPGAAESMPRPTFLLKMEMRGPSEAGWQAAGPCRVVELWRTEPTKSSASAIARLVAEGVIDLERARRARCVLCGSLSGWRTSRVLCWCVACGVPVVSRWHHAFAQFKLREAAEAFVLK